MAIQPRATAGIRNAAFPRVNRAIRNVISQVLWYPLAGIGANCLLLCITGCAHTASQSAVALCPHIVAQQHILPSLDDMERRLVCGDPDTKDIMGKAWHEVPFSQAEYFLRNFLQARGYQSPVFVREPGRLLVTPGPMTRIREIHLTGISPDLVTAVDMGRKRDVLGTIMTPGALDGLEAWVRRRLQNLGYPCPTLKTDADRVSGVVSIGVRAAGPLPILGVKEEPIEGMGPGVLRRYDAFGLGDVYAGDLLDITQRRMTALGGIQSAFLRTRCVSEGVWLDQAVYPGAPRLLTIGFGANTEGALVAKFVWTDSRLGPMASQVQTAARGSSHTQDLSGDVTWYLLPHPSRFFLRPLVSLTHDNEQSFEIVSGRAQIKPGTTWDGNDIAINFQSGPAFDAVHTISGPGPSKAMFLSLESEVSVMGHGYELNRASPRTGANLSFLAAANRKGWGSDASAQRFNLHGESLWNLRSYDPPFVIVGTRATAATIVSGERPGPGTLLPPTYLHYLGGSQDLRGFGRQELPEGGNGAMSVLYGGVEFRLSRTLPAGIEPFVFSDAGAMGSHPSSLDSPIYWSPGLGVRWESGFGTFRGTLAHGYTFKGDPLNPSILHWQGYLSFGEEF